MHKFGIIAVIMLLSGIGSAYIGTVDKPMNCTCLKIIYLGPDGKNLTFKDMMSTSLGMIAGNA